MHHLFIIPALPVAPLATNNLTFLTVHLCAFVADSFAFVCISWMRSSPPWLSALRSTPLVMTRYIRISRCSAGDPFAFVSRHLCAFVADSFAFVINSQLTTDNLAFMTHHLAFVLNTTDSWITSPAFVHPFSLRWSLACFSFLHSFPFIARHLCAFVG